MIHEMFVATVAREFGGDWAMGETAEEAVRKVPGRKSKKRTKVYRFSSELPFAPRDRDATEEEADVWVDQSGSIYWVRCRERTLTISPTELYADSTGDWSIEDEHGQGHSTEYAKELWENGRLKDWNLAFQRLAEHDFDAEAASRSLLRM